MTETTHDERAAGAAAHATRVASPEVPAETAEKASRGLGGLAIALGIFASVSALLLVAAVAGFFLYFSGSTPQQERSEAVVSEDVGPSILDYAFGSPSGPTYGAAGGTRTVAEDISSECPRNPETFTIARGKPKVLNGHGCQLRWKIRYGCVRALASDGTVLSKRVCAGGGEAKIPPGLHTIVAVGGPAKVKRIECPLGSPGNLLDFCS